MCAQESQAYPPEYGAETANLILATKVVIDVDAWCLDTLLDEGEYYRSPALTQWADADLGKVWDLVLKRP
jgi:hypothetical protein